MNRVKENHFREFEKIECSTEGGHSCQNQLVLYKVATD